MSRLKQLICLAGLALALLVPAAHADTYPTKTIRITVPYATGAAPTSSRGCSRRS